MQLSHARPRRYGRYAATGVVFCAMLLVAGCAGQELLPINDAAEFQKVVIESSRPVVVEMFKGG